MTGFSPAVRKLLEERSSGWCEVCGINTAAEAHHRRARGAGGTKRPETNQAANGLMLCRDCHRLAESYRTVALTCGWLVAQSRDPGLVPVVYRGQVVRLDDDGGKVAC